jgi:hypothetical protein
MLKVIHGGRRGRGVLSQAKRQAVEASLVARLRQHRSRRRADLIRNVATFIGSAALIAVPLALAYGPPLVGCSVKGNISVNTGERIYHVPGQMFYDVTRIDLLNGERWFCSEEAARAAGWRKSRR